MCKQKKKKKPEKWKIRLVGKEEEQGGILSMLSEISTLDQGRFNLFWSLR